MRNPRDRLSHLFSRHQRLSWLDGDAAEARIEELPRERLRSVVQTLSATASNVTTSTSRARRHGIDEEEDSERLELESWRIPEWE